MRELLKNPFYIYGNLFYLFFLLGFTLYTHPSHTVFHRYSWHYFWVLIAMLFSCVPYNCLLIFPLLDDLKFTLNDKTYREAHINRTNPGLSEKASGTQDALAHA